MARHYDITLDGDGGVLTCEPGSKMTGEVDGDALILLINTTSGPAKIDIDDGALLRLLNGSQTLFSDGSTLEIAGATTVAEVKSSAILKFLTGGGMELGDGANLSTLEVKAISKIVVEDNAIIEMDPGSVMNVEGGSLGTQAQIRLGTFSPGQSGGELLVGGLSGVGVPGQITLEGGAGAGGLLLVEDNATIDVEDGANITINGLTTTFQLTSQCTLQLLGGSGLRVGDDSNISQLRVAKASRIEVTGDAVSPGQILLTSQSKMVANNTLADAATPAVNGIYGNNIAKAWGAFTWAGGAAGSVTWHGDKFNINAVVTYIDAFNLEVTFLQNMGDVNYQVITSGVTDPGSYIAVPRVFQAAHSVSAFRVNWLRSDTGAPLDLTGDDIDQPVRFVVFGDQ